MTSEEGVYIDYYFIFESNLNKMIYLFGSPNCLRCFRRRKCRQIENCEQVRGRDPLQTFVGLTPLLSFLLRNNFV